MWLVNFIPALSDVQFSLRSNAVNMGNDHVLRIDYDGKLPIAGCDIHLLTLVLL